MTKPTPSPSTLLDGFPGGTTWLIIGPPKVGKSTLLGSIGELTKNVLLMTAKPAEINSWLYDKYGFSENAEVYRDYRWKPILDLYEADGFLKAHRRLLELYEDTVLDAVLVEMTDFVQLAKHNILKANRVASPEDLPGKGAKIGFYGKLKDDLKDFTQTLVGLASKELSKPKHIFVAIHAQPTKEEDIKGQPTAEADAKGVQFFGDVLPMVEGGYRVDIASEFDIVGFSTVKHTSNIVKGRMHRSTEYVVQLQPDPEKHAGARLCRALATKEFPNHLPTILRAIKEAREAA